MASFETYCVSTYTNRLFHCMIRIGVIVKTYTVNHCSTLFSLSFLKSAGVGEEAACSILGYQSSMYFRVCPYCSFDNENTQPDVMPLHRLAQQNVRIQFHTPPDYPGYDMRMMQTVFPVEPNVSFGLLDIAFPSDSWPANEHGSPAGERQHRIKLYEQR